MKSTLFAVLFAAITVRADDWPQWMGPGRDGVWRETGVVERFTSNSLPLIWRVPVNAGYVGPAVAGGRLFLLDRVAGRMPERQRGDKTLPMVPGNERVLCLDTATGSNVWEHAYDCAYRISYPAGPRATPVVRDGRVYTMGAMGDLRCLDAGDGRVIWARNFPKDFSLDEPPVWGWAAHPLLDGPRLICLVGGTNSAVVAFDKDTGRELWRALTTQEIGYAPPMIYEIAGRRQLVIWHPEAVVGLEPESGRVRWSETYPIEGRPQRPEVTIAAPRWDGRRLFVTSFYQGSALLEPELDSVRVVWNRRGSRQSEFDAGLHTVMGTPVFRDGLIYGVCGFGELRCLDATTGDRRWETYAATGGEKGFFANAFLTEQAGRTWLFNDQGELILARLSPVGYEELGRAKLLEPQETTRGRTVLWCHPAYAGRRAYPHNGKELICVDLAAPPA